MMMLFSFTISFFLKTINKININQQESGSIFILFLCLRILGVPMICAIPSVCNKSHEMSTMLFRLLLSAENGKILCIATMASYLISGEKKI